MIRPGVGRIASHLAGTRLRTPIAMGAAAGVTAGFLARGGPWREDIVPTVQETAFGDPRATQNMLRGSIVAAARGGLDDIGPTDFYYGQPVNLRHSRSTMDNPVPGEMVLGMYNLRR